MDEKAPVRNPEPILESNSRVNVSVTSMHKKENSIQPKRRSIHERIRINKEMIAKKQGKGNKGVDFGTI